jgi:hypothetical protein
VDVPIQLIDAAFATPPSTCAGAQTDPATAGFNGILGVATFEHDCGGACASSSNNGLYYACGTTGCAGTALPLGSQVRNPVAALPLDGNGVVVRLPAVPAAGAASVSGELVLGIGTRGNNVPPASVVAFPLDVSGELRTTLGGVTSPAFLDTGSNGLFLPYAPTPALTTCPAPNAGWFCPASPVTLTATNAGAQGAPSAALSFRIASIAALAPSVEVSSAVGGPAPGPSGVDWGLPFHLGRDVYVRLEGRASSLGAGPLVAY